MTLAFRDAVVPDSPLARWDARWKLAAVLVCSFSVAFLVSPVAAGVAAGVAVALTYFGRVPPGVLLARLGLLVLAVSPVLVVLPFTAQDGWKGAAVVALRAVTIGTLALTLVWTAPLSRTFTAANRLFVPGVLVQIAHLAYRYALLFFGETRRMRVALRTRGFRPATNSHTYRTLGSSAGTLLVRGGDRAERVADAMRTRGFDGRFHSVTAFRTTAWDVLGFAAVVAVFAALILWDRVA